MRLTEIREFNYFNFEHELNQYDGRCLIPYLGLVQENSEIDDTNNHLINLQDFPGNNSLLPKIRDYKLKCYNNDYLIIIDSTGEEFAKLLYRQRNLLPLYSEVVLPLFCTINKYNLNSVTTFPEYKTFITKFLNLSEELFQFTIIYQLPISPLFQWFLGTMNKVESLLEINFEISESLKPLYQLYRNAIYLICAILKAILNGMRGQDLIDAIAHLLRRYPLPISLYPKIRQILVHIITNTGGGDLSQIIDELNDPINIDDSSLPITNNTIDIQNQINPIIDGYKQAFNNNIDSTILTPHINRFIDGFIDDFINNNNLTPDEINEINKLKGFYSVSDIENKKQSCLDKINNLKNLINQWLNFPTSLKINIKLPTIKDLFDTCKKG